MANPFLKFFNKLRFKREQIEAPRRSFGISGGVYVDEHSSMQVSAFHRGVIYISTQVAKLPWDVKDAKNNILTGDRIGYLLDVLPNPEMHSMLFRLVMMQNAILHGNSYAEIERDMMGRPVALWPIPSKNVQAYRLPDGKLVYQILGGTVDGSEVYLPAKDVLHIRNFHTVDGITGLGLVAYGKDVLGISLGANQMAGNLFGNGGMPSGVLEVAGTLNEEAVQRMKQSWTEAHGRRKAGGVAVLEEGAKYKPVSMDPTMLQFLESRQFSVLEIARFLGVPPTKLYDVTAATYNNQENSSLEVVTDTLDSWTKMFELEVDIKLLNGQYGGRYSEIDLYAVHRGDMTTRANYFSKMMQAAAITPNQIRQKEGLPPYEGGDRYFVAINNFTPADRIDEVIDSQISKDSEPKEDQEVEDSEEDKQIKAAIVQFLNK
jgi:HK97 family phage portal protein